MHDFETHKTIRHGNQFSKFLSHKPSSKCHRPHLRSVATLKIVKCVNWFFSETYTLQWHITQWTWCYWSMAHDTGITLQQWTVIIHLD